MPKREPLNFERNAPDFKLQSVSGEAVQLSSLWAEKPLLLAFALLAVGSPCFCHSITPPAMLVTCLYPAPSKISRP